MYVTMPHNASETLTKAASALRGKLDLLGTDDMVVDKMYYPKSGAPYLTVPCGKKCKTCLLRDDDWDPVRLAVDKKKMFTVWSRSLDPANGKTREDQCFYCVKVYNGLIKRSREPPVSLGEYKVQLTEEAKMKMHVQVVVMCILHIINEGGHHTMKVDLPAIHKKVLVLQNKKAMQKERPGFKHYPTALYEEKEWPGGFKGPLATNGMLSKGHRAWTMDGVPGVLVPDEQVTSIRMTEEMAILMNENIGATDDGHTSQQLELMQHTMFQSFWNESSGGLEACVDTLLNGVADGEAASSSGITGLIGTAAGSGQQQMSAVPDSTVSGAGRRGGGGGSGGARRKAESAGEPTPKKPNKRGGGKAGDCGASPPPSTQASPPARQGGTQASPFASGPGAGGAGDKQAEQGGDQGGNNKSKIWAPERRFCKGHRRGGRDVQGDARRFQALVGLRSSDQASRLGPLGKEGQQSHPELW